MLRPFLCAWLATAACATPVLGLATNLTTPLLEAPPTVTIKNGTVTGSRFLLDLVGVESFKGIPFAQPPVNNLRLKPPQTLTKGFDNLDATSSPPSCIQFVTQLPTEFLPTQLVSSILNGPLGTTLTGASEDCLYLNVQRPSGTTKDSKLPVVAWIYGGGFALGSINMYDGTSIVRRSVQLGAPVIYVAMNYRLAAYGFMGGKELKSDGSTNLGLRDQRKALEWIKENIAAFGGDPDNVVIWGESAGAISVFDQIIINNGDNTYMGKPLFNGAVMNSGSAIPAHPVDHHKPQKVYDTVVSAAGCSGVRDTLACLRSISTEKFSAAMSTLPGILSYTSVDLAYVPRPDPSDNFFSKSPEDAAVGSAFPKIPIIIGDQEDEGTLFSLFQLNLTTSEDTLQYFQGWFPDASPKTVSRLVDAYPDNPEDGSPFRTGILNNIYPQFKRVAAIIGDITFTLTRRSVLETVVGQEKIWSYLNSYLYLTPILGTFHGADIAVLFGPLPTTLTTPILPIDYYISFFTKRDPNALFATQKDATFWPQWQNDTRQLLHFDALSTSLLKDDFRPAQYAALQDVRGKLRI